MAERRFEHSTDGGKIWTPIDVKPGSLLANITIPADYYDDGYGNLYREVKDDV